MAEPIVPLRATVKPRTISPETGDVLPLEDAIIACADQRRTGVIQITGRPGSGRTAALRHLLAVLPPLAHVRFIDDAVTAEVRDLAESCLVVCGTLASAAQTGDAVLHLTPWGTDECIEYLLAVHPQQCRSVMARLDSATDKVVLKGLPELWRIVLDWMAADESICTVKAALRKEIDGRLPSLPQKELARGFCLEARIGSQQKAAELYKQLAAGGFEAGWLKVMRQEIVQHLIATDAMIVALQAQWDDQLWWLARRLPMDLVNAVAEAAGEPERQRLQALTCEQNAYYAMAASILHATGVGWKPTSKHPPAHLSGAYLRGAVWPGIDLAVATLDRADLRSAQLSNSNLERAVLDSARFGKASLSGARMVQARACGTDFSDADLSSADLQCAELFQAKCHKANFFLASLYSVNLSEADLTDARLERADLQLADLAGAQIEGADFSEANLRFANLEKLPLHRATLTAACFAHANLHQCDLESQELPDADFRSAILRGALLSGSRMPRANFQNANLRETGLAEIEWEQADLRRADFSGCTFHMGSARSGLVDSPIASEGTRTGFYTDDFQEQYFKAPEEVRKANLCGADLRYAVIDGVDFYLVDLRGAVYTEDQRRWFQRCGAILYDQE